MEKVIIEVGSTCTKIDLYKNGQIKRLETVTIEFKKNYTKLGKLDALDVGKLVDKVNEMKNKYDDVYVCGTSIFRSLQEQERDFFLDVFEASTDVEFDIVSIDRENELTVLGATKSIEDAKVCVLIGGGGSTEISIYEDEILEMVNSDFGVMDVMKQFPDLAEDFATTSLEEVKEFIRGKLKLPTQMADVLILAGGGHKFFVENAGIRHESNFLYPDALAPIMMDVITREKETKRFYTEISLDAIRAKVDDPNWWYATRAMCAFVLVVAEEIGAKYIVPTDISMVYGIVREGEEE